MSARISTRARDDLDHIFAYLSVTYGEPAADDFLDQAKQSIAFLVQNPEAGPHPKWLRRQKELRFWVISRTNYLIYYLPDEMGVSIERVLDGRRDVKRIVQHRREEPGSAE